MIPSKQCMRVERRLCDTALLQDLYRPPCAYHDGKEERVHEVYAAAQARIVWPEEHRQQQRAVAAHQRANALRRPAQQARLHSELWLKPNP